MAMPNFLLIGAAKSGTDALCAYLAQHPDVYLSGSKEPNFFVAEGMPEIPYRGPGDRETLRRLNMWVTTLADYQSLFADVSGQRAVGEGSTWYLYHERAPGRIRAHVPDARLIAILRNPVDRAYSAFTMLMRDGRETTSDFERALQSEDARVGAGWEPVWHYRRMGLYHAQLCRYYTEFRGDQVHVVLYDDLVSRPREVARELFRFLEVDDRFEPDVSGRFNVSLVPTRPAYHRLVAGPHPLKAAVKSVLPAGLRQSLKRRLVPKSFTRPQPLAADVRRRLVEVFRPDVLRLQDFLGRDLSAWL
jgi:hypothetical protein